MTYNIPTLNSIYTSTIQFYANKPLQVNQRARIQKGSSIRGECVDLKSVGLNFFRPREYFTWTKFEPNSFSEEYGPYCIIQSVWWGIQYAPYCMEQGPAGTAWPTAVATVRFRNRKNLQNRQFKYFHLGLRDFSWGKF